MWLENDVFLVAHTPSSQDPDSIVPETSYTLITRAKSPQVGIKFQKLPEPVGAFGMNRGTQYQFLQRMRDFPPDLTDIIIVASTGSGDVGLVTRSKAALTSEVPADQITNIFATTTMAEDSRRAQLPMTITGEMVETSPIGVAIDLSSKDKVARPLPKEEFDESPGPLPALMILNNEGVLMTWWIVYSESIRQRTSFPGLAVLGGTQPQQRPLDQRQASPFGLAAPQPTSAFGQSSFGQPSSSKSAFGTPSSNAPSSSFGAATTQGVASGAPAPAFGGANAPSSAFGSTNTGSAFGARSSPGGAFGSAPALGKPASPWGGASNNSSASPAFGKPAFGKPAFGSSTPLGASSSGPAFGQTGSMGRASPWGAPQGTNTFGQTGSAPATATTFGSTNSATGSSPATSNGFASFASKPSSFLASGNTPAQNIFGKPSTGAPFGSDSNTTSPFGQMSKPGDAPKSVFGGGSGFTLGSTFKADGTAKNDGPKPTCNAVGSMFGSNFGDVLGKTGNEPPQTKDADMEDDSNNLPEEDTKGQGLTNEKTAAPMPAEPPKPANSFANTQPPKDGGVFGTQSQAGVTPAEVATSKPAAANWQPGKPTANSDTPKEIHVKGKTPPAITTSPKIKPEPSDSDNENPTDTFNQNNATPPEPSTRMEPSDSKDSETPEAPLPPESTSKASFAPGDSSNSSKSSNEEPSEPPLPPDPFPNKSKLSKVESASAESPPHTKTPLPDPKSDADQTTVGEPPGLPDEDEDEGLDTEGSGVDVAQDFSSPSDQTHSPKDTKDMSFSFPKSPAGGLFSNAAPQQSLSKGPPLFGEVESSSGVFGRPSAPFFPQPSKTQQSPRSPSPVRQSQLSLAALRPDNSRSVSAPGPLKPTANRKAAMVQVPLKQSQPPSIELRKQEEQRIAAERARQMAEENQNLSDDEDEQVRCELEAPVIGSRSLDPFLAHQDYVGNIDKPGIPGQIEKVYRDINSMIDTLGLNARSLAAFVKGHCEEVDDEEIFIDDLEHPEDFALEEISKLIALEAQLSEDIDSHRVTDIQGDLSACRDLRKDIQSLRHKRNDMNKAVELRNDAESTESALSGSLSLEQASQQYDVRKKFAHFQRLLAQTEEDLTMLRAKLASCEQSRPGSSAGLPAPKKPTVEAVTKTILKMTNMAEKKSGDIDMLEVQLRAVRLSSVEGGRSSREGSPLAASAGRKSGGLRSSLSGGKTTQNGGVPLQGSPLRRSLNGDGSPTPGAGGLAADEISLYREKARRRKEFNALVRQALEKTPPRIRTLE